MVAQPAEVSCSRWPLADVDLLDDVQSGHSNEWPLFVARTVAYCFTYTDAKPDSPMVKEFPFSDPVPLLPSLSKWKVMVVPLSTHVPLSVKGTVNAPVASVTRAVAVSMKVPTPVAMI
jgi:hypothetical protein